MELFKREGEKRASDFVRGVKSIKVPAGKAKIGKGSGGESVALLRGKQEGNHKH